MCDLTSYTRWDSAHKQSIRIEYQDIPNEDEWIIESRKYFGLNVFSLHSGVADIFGVPTVKSEDVDEAVRQAKENGDLVLFMVLGDHSAYRFRIQDSLPEWDWDSGCCGVITLSREMWSQIEPGKPFSPELVAKFFSDEFDELVTAELNGWFYMAVINGPEPDDCDIRTGYLSPEEALRDVMSDYPAIHLTDN